MATRREAGLRRGVGVGLVASVLVVNLAAAVFVSLGVVADQALGLTPLVFVAAGGVFLLTLFGYAEAIAMLPEAGGAAGYARRGFGELPSFLVGWALMLDYLILVVLAAYFAVHYLGSLPGLGFLLDSPADAIGAGVLIVMVAALALRGVRAGARVSIGVSLVAVLAQFLLAAVGLIVLFEPAKLIDAIDLGTTPSWAGLLFALPIAMIGFTGLESVANHGEELERPGRDVPRPLIWSAIVGMFMFVAMSIVALDAQPVVGSGAEARTALGESTGWVDRPVIGIIEAFELGDVAAGSLRVVFGLLAAGVLLLVARSAIGGVGRVAYTMSRHRQAPSMLFSVGRRTGVPQRAVVMMTIVALALLAVTVSVSDSAVVLAQVYAFGATLTATITLAAVVRLRRTEPELERPYRAPGNVTVRGRSVPLTAVAGVVASAAMWCIVVLTHDAARVVGLSWMVAGFVAYATYRMTHGLPLVARAEPREVRPLHIDAETYRRVLVAVRPEPGLLYGAGDAEIIGLANKLLERDGRALPEVDVVLVHELPLTKPIDAPLGDAETQSARRLGLIADVAAKLDVRIVSTVLRARAAGRAICQQAELAGSDAVLLATRSKQRHRGEAFGRTVAYVLRHAPCDVVVLQLPEQTLLRAAATDRAEE
ncbi:MAG: Basic amino acid/polyamine antiporter, family [Thermoleophilia bacterium]|nr:UspA domain protein [Thermoleophilia bacterium]MCZ4496620.1 Basic amino acid/polyamine antiporter, family [Thermoleophilia bacterium]